MIRLCSCLLYTVFIVQFVLDIRQCHAYSSDVSNFTFAAEASNFRFFDIDERTNVFGRGLTYSVASKLSRPWY